MMGWTKMIKIKKIAYRGAGRECIRVDMVVDGVQIVWCVEAWRWWIALAMVASVLGLLLGFLIK